MVNERNKYKNCKIDNIYIDILQQLIYDNKYNKYLLSNDDIWELNLASIKMWINRYNKIPKYNDDNIYEKKLALWLYVQQKKYKYYKRYYIKSNNKVPHNIESYNKQINTYNGMKYWHIYRYRLFDKFINEYNNYKLLR